MKVKELINELEKLPEDLTVELGVYYDNCLHLQELDKIQASPLDFDWITLIGKKE